MSRKCPSCKKWLASGQFTCKCGYGEARLTPEEDIQFGRIQRELDQTHIETPGQNRWFYRAPTPEALELQGARVRAAEDFVLGDERRAKALGNSASLLSQAVRANSVAMLRALLPHCTEGVHNMRDSRGLSPLSVAIDMVREECFGLLLEMLPVELCDLKFVLPKQNRSALQHLSDQRYYHSTFGFQEHDPQAGAKLAEACERMLQLAYGKLGLSEEFQGVQGAAVRAQRAAATQQVATPPLFPRSVWVILVHFCAPRERDVVLPCVCRFFRNLAPPDIRVLRIFDAVMALNPLEVNANAKVHRKRLESMMRFLAQDRDGTLNPAMVFGLGRQSGSFYHRYTELLKQVPLLAQTPELRPWLTQARLALSGKELNQLTGNPTNQVAVSLGDTSVQFAWTPSHCSHTLSLSVESPDSGITFKLADVNPRDFGSHDAGFAAIERAHAGVAEAASILGLPSVEPEQVVVLLACILQPNHDSFFPVPEKFRWAEDDFDNSMASFMQRFLLNSTAVLTIKRRDSLDLSASANVDTVPTASMLEMLRWSPTKLADFFDACGLDGCRDVVKQKQLTGRNYVEGSMSQFIPEDVASVADRKAMEDLLADVKERAWSERRK